MLLEEGEIAWLRYQEDLESSSDEENGPISDFVRLGFFLLDGNNNLEDDSSVSEDLDVEWRYAFHSCLLSFQRFCSYYFIFCVRCKKYLWLSVYACFKD